MIYIFYELLKDPSYVVEGLLYGRVIWQNIANLSLILLL